MGRPAEYGPDVVELICARLVDGESLREICRDEAMPARSTIFRWLAVHEDFRVNYAHAREMQADAWADEIVAIADDAFGDWMERGGRHVVNAERIQRSRLRVDARKWLMGKAAPKKYGEKVAGKDGAGLVVEIVRFGE
jgi:hypothetical protein